MPAYILTRQNMDARLTPQILRDLQFSFTGIGRFCHSFPNSKDYAVLRALSLPGDDIMTIFVDSEVLDVAATHLEGLEDVSTDAHGLKRAMLKAAKPYVLAAFESARNGFENGGNQNRLPSNLKCGSWHILFAEALKDITPKRFPIIAQKTNAHSSDF